MVNFHTVISMSKGGRTGYGVTSHDGLIHPIVHFVLYEKLFDTV